MTDADIIKALECCVTIDGCKKCPRGKNGKICKDYNEFIRAILDLINRQKAEIEEEKQAYSRILECYTTIMEELDGVRQKRAAYENMFLDLGFSLQDVKDIELKEIKAWKERMIWHVRKCNELHNENERQKTEITRLEDILRCQADGIIELNCQVAQAKASAIKAFAEKLKAKMNDFARIDYNGARYFFVGEGAIDKVAKEMVGDGS